MSAIRSIVVVDDDIDHALIVRLVLSEVAPQADVTVFTDRHDLTRRLTETPTGALVLMDRMLDGQDGSELLPLVRQARPDLNLVMLSAHLSDRDRAQALAAGAHYATEKPSSILEWRTLLSDLVVHGAARRVVAA